MKVSEVVNRNVISVSPNEDLAHVRRLFLRYGITKIPVFDEGLLVGAVTEMEVAKAYELTRGPIETVKVGEVMTDDVVAVSPGDELEAVIPEAIKRALVVVTDKNGEFLGILTKTDILRAKQNDLPPMPLSSVITSKVKTIRPDQSIFRAVKIMKENKIKHLPVVEGRDKVIGIVSAKDIALSTFGLRPKKVTFIRHSAGGMRKVVKIVPQTVGGVMRTPVDTASPRLNVRKAATRLLNKNIGSIVVTESSRLRGLVTKTDLLHAVKKEQ